MKGRLHQPSLADVHGAFAREQALAKQSLGPVQAAAFHEESLVGDENVADHARIVDEKHVLACHLHVGEVAIGPPQVGEERERIAAVSVDEERADRTGRAGPGRPSGRYAPATSAHGFTFQRTTRPCLT